VGAENAGEVIEAGASGASVISAILGAAEPETATRQLVEAGRLLDIDVLDHIVIGRQGFVSLLERVLGFPKP
jgi:hypothetical protein